MGDKDFYAILGVSRKASEAEIKRAYRALAKKYHPDVNRGDKSAEERFKEISEAYETLSDSKKRQEYDMYGAFGAAGTGAGYRGGGGFYQGQRTGPMGGFDFSSYTNQGWGGTRVEYEDLGDIFGDLFGMGGGGKGFRTKTKGSPEKGSDRVYSMDIDFLDSVRGMTSKIALPTEGKVQKINVKIPPGVKTGSKIRLAKKGDSSPAGGPPGDLYIDIKVRPHPFFTRDGDDIYLQFPISLEEAIKGAQVEVPTIDGPIKMKFPPGTQGGQKLRVKGRGVPHRDGEGRGDQYVIANIQIPKSLDAESMQLLEEFLKRNPYNPRAGLF